MFTCTSTFTCNCACTCMTVELVYLFVNYKSNITTEEKVHLLYLLVLL